MSVRFPGQRLRVSLAASLASLVALIVAACGGSTSQYEVFVAERVLAFGDDASALTPAGRTYSVNGVNATTGAFDCTLQPNWVQSVATFYGMVLAECNTGTPPAVPLAFTRAAPGAKARDVATQIDAQIAAGGFRDKDLALFFVGMNDVLELYAQYPARSEESLIAEAGARGESAAALVNRLVDLGAKVIVSNLPDMGLSPYARAEATTHAASGFDRAALITRITTAFNERLGVRIRIDGRFVGLAQLDLRTQQARISPGSFGFTDIATAVCTVPLPDCTTATVATGANAATYLWADATRLGLGGQASLATLALQRAQSNPF